ncbi:type II toxin-antitoxin system RatA family toxin [Motilimonas eburnea]|uniref:type II toxin-antitoxin system RatA family toxin n=1 Tax=Motilimonas eburnea TaxID=1737488 RepID=UPI001E3ECC47|nr:type II toxin-antitoxin system RatA family toxin [Motilimonas eburnea]MCE2573372.1 type II toxin-antitoxin system RatA family toxin [Motilimonas eburnea]
MAQISKSALVMFSANEMFDLVNDVVAYPEFLPGCAGSRILEQTERTMRASVNVAKAGITKTFTTENTLVPGERIIMQLVDGPFKHLKGGWTFTPLDDKACKVALDLEFEFSSKLVEVAFGRVFNELCHAMVSAFSERAKEVYCV